MIRSDLTTTDEALDDLIRRYRPTKHPIEVSFRQLVPWIAEKLFQRTAKTLSATSVVQGARMVQQSIGRRISLQGVVRSPLAHSGTEDL
jgi:hypothetical protein